MNEKPIYWKVPKFEKLDKLSELMDKALANEIEMSKVQIQDLHNILEVKRKLEKTFNRKTRK